MQALQDFRFVQAFMMLGTVAFFWFGLAFPVGWRWGSRAGAMVLVSGLTAYVMGLAACAIWAVASGQWADFSATLGPAVLAEMATFVFLMLYTVYFMASRYLNDKRARERDEARQLLVRSTGAPDVQTARESEA